MIFQYNGVNLQMVSLDRVLREPVYDPSNTDLLYVRWLITATCVYSPGGWPHATALKGPRPEPGLPTGRGYNGVGDLRRDDAGTTDGLVTPEMATGTPPKVENGGSTPDQRGNETPRPGEPPTGQFTLPGAGGPRVGTTLPDPKLPAEYETRAYMTDVELRKRLWLPRKQLRIGWPNSDDPADTKGWWMVAPSENRRVDPANGPFPLALDVVDMGGEGLTFGVNFQIAACTPAGSEDNLVLSHRWEMTHVHDDSGYLTRLTDGVIVFNGAEVEASGVNPDWLRNQFYLPIPLGFRRYLDPVTQSPDGLTIRYRIRDVDQTVVFDPGDSGATQMDIQETVEYIVPWGAVAVAGAVKKVMTPGTPWWSPIRSIR